MLPAHEARINLVDHRPVLGFYLPVVGYTLQVKAKGYVFKDGFNLRLLEQIARSTGGTINPGPEQEQKTEYTAVKVTFLRSYFIFLAALLFLMEVFFRRFFLREIWLVVAREGIDRHKSGK
jgi:hypothetical protein